MNIDYEVARNTLQEVFSDVQGAHVEGRGLQAPKALGEPYDLLFESRTQAYREVLLGCILARLQQPKVNVRFPYVQQGEFAYNGRTLDEKVGNPFLHREKIPSSKGPFLSVFRRSVTFTEDTRSGLRDQKGFDAMLEVLRSVETTGEKRLREILRYHLYRFILLREESQIDVIRPRRVSLPQCEEMISSMISTASGGRFPVFLVVATFIAIRERFGLRWDVRVQGINVADSASGAGGDVTVVEDGQIVLAVEVTERCVDKSRVVATFDTTVAPSGIEDYLFVVKDRGDVAEAMKQARQYFSQGYEVNFVEMKQWICAVLAVLGAKGRARFVDKLVEYISGEDVPAGLKQAWNDIVVQLASGERET